MKNRHYFTIFLMAFISLFATSCTDEDRHGVDLFAPVAELTNDALKGLPGETLDIVAKVSDDVGLKSIKIENLDWEISETISFSDQNYITEYDLNQSIIIPGNAIRGTSTEIVITTEDHSGKKSLVKQLASIIPEETRLEINQEMGYAITLNGLVGIANANNEVSFTAAKDVKWNVKLTLSTNNTKLQSLTVVCPSLNWNDEINLTDLTTDEGKKCMFEKVYEVKGSTEQNNVVITLKDDKGNTATYTPSMSIKATFATHNQKHLKLYTLDKSIDLKKVVFGLPMLTEQKTVESYKFTAKYYASKDNTEIFFVSSKSSDNQVKYGASSDDKYIIKSTNPKPFVLPTKGHYEIVFDLLLGTYKITSLGQQSSPYQNTYIGGGFNGYSGDEMAQMADAPAIYTKEWKFEQGTDLAFGIGGGEWLVATGPDSNDPEIWLLKADKNKYPDGTWFFDTAVPACEGTIYFDAYLTKMYMIRK